MQIFSFSDKRLNATEKNENPSLVKETSATDELEMSLKIEHEDEGKEMIEILAQR